MVSCMGSYKGSYLCSYGYVANQRLGGPRLGQDTKLIIKKRTNVNYRYKVALLYGLCSQQQQRRGDNPSTPATAALSGMGLPR